MSKKCNKSNQNKGWNQKDQVDLLLGVKSYGEEMGFKKWFKNRQRRGLFNVQRQIIP